MTLSATRNWRLFVIVLIVALLAAGALGLAGPHLWPTAAAGAAQMDNMDGTSGTPAQSAPTTGADIVRAPSDLPGPIGNRPPQTVRVDIETKEVEGQLADGTTFAYMTFGGKVPGPFIRARVGDTIELHLKNPASNKLGHSIDLHAVTGPGGGMSLTMVAPGQEKSFTFKALKPGLYVYHCATPMVAHHLTSGMYGLILIEPEGGLPPVDHEYYVMQGELYTTGAYGEKGHQDVDMQKLLGEKPEYFVFNGAVGALQKHPLEAKVGETVRIYFGDAGPNYASSFHVIGAIFDKVYEYGSLTSTPLTDVQTTIVPPGGATVVELTMQVPGDYLLVDHSLSRLQRGIGGLLHVTGPDQPGLFHAGPATP